MNLEELNSMRYSDLLKLAKEKLNITRRVSKNMLVESLMQLERNLELQRNFISDDDSDDEKPVIPEPTQPEPVVVAKRGRKRSKKQEEAVEQQKKKSKNDSTVDQPTTAAAPVLNSTFDAEKMEETLNTTFDVEEPKQKRSRGNKNKSNSEPVVAEQPKKVVAVASRKLKKSISEPVPSEPAVSSTVEPMPDEPKKQVLTAGRKLKKSLSEPPTKAKEEEEEPVTTKKVVVATRKLKRSNGFTVEPLVLKQKVATPPVHAAAVPGSAKKPFTPNLRRTTMEVTAAGSATPPLMKMPATPATVVKSVRKVVPSQPLPITSSIPKRKAAPNFAEIHQKQFDKMQSVDEYVEKKKTRNEAIVTGSALKNRLNATLQTPAKTPAATATNAPSKTPLKFNFVSGIQKPVFTAQGLVAVEKKRVVATVKENLNQQQPSTMTAAAVNKPKGGAKMTGSSRVSANASTLSLSKQMIKGVRTNRRFELQMAHRNMQQQQ